MDGPDVIVLQKEQLSHLLPALEKQFPASLMVYHLVRNVIRHKFEWPGLTIAVDKFPDFSVCVVCTDPRASEEDKSIPPLVNGYAVFIHSTDPEKLKIFLDKSGSVIEWSRTIGFHGIENPTNSSILITKCQKMGGSKTVCEPVYFVDSAVFIAMGGVAKANFKYSLPDGCRLGCLTEDHAHRLTTEKHYGDLDKNLVFFKYLLKHFPSSAIFDQNDIPVAYVFLGPDGSLSGGYVAPEYRSRGFFKIVCYDLVKSLLDMGEQHIYTDVLPSNPASTNALLAIGGQFYDNYDSMWFEYIPPSKTS